MLSDFQLVYLKDRIIEDLTKDEYISYTSKGLRVLTLPAPPNSIEYDRHIKKVEKVLELLNPDLARGQMSLARGLSIYNECTIFGG